MSDMDVTIKARVEGAEAVAQAVAAMKQQLEALNGLSSSGSGSSLPTGAPASAPRPPDPNGGYVTPQNVTPLGTPAGGNGLPALASYSPGGGYQGGMRYAPGQFAPSPSGYGPAGGVTPMGTPSGGAGGMTLTAGTINITAQTVTINAQNVHGGGQGGQGSAGGSGGSGGNQPPTGAPPPPEPTAGRAGFWSSVMKNPSISGIGQAGLEALPLGSVAVLGAAAEYGSVLMNSAYAGQMPGYNLQTQLMAQRAAGQYINPILEAGQYQAAQIRGDAAANRALISPFTSIPLVGGMISSVAELGYHAYGINIDGFQQSERDATLAEAKAQGVQQQLYLARLTGIKISSMNSEDPTRGFHAGLARSLLPFGMSAAAQGGSMRIGGEMSNSLAAFGVEGMMGAFGAVSRLGLDAMNPGMRRELQQHGYSQNAVGEAAGQYAIRGDLSGLSTLFPLMDPASFDKARRNADGVQNIQREMALSGSRLAIGQNTGAGYKQLGGELTLQGGQLDRWIGKARAARDAAPADQKGDYDAFILQLEVQKSAIPRQKAEIEYGQRGGLISASESQAGLKLQQTLYSGGGERELYRGFATRAAQQTREVRLLREKANRSDIYNEPERAQFAAQASQIEYQANTGTAREYSSTVYGLAQGRAALTLGRAAAASADAGLFGNADATQAAGLQQAGGIREQLRAVQEYLNRGNLSLEEQLRLQSQIIDLRRQEVVVTEEAYRGAAQQRLSVSQAQQGLLETGLHRDYLRGAGGPSSYGQVSMVATQASGSLLQARQNLSDFMRRNPNTPSDNPALVSLQQQVGSAETNVSQSVLALGSIPQPLAVTQAERRGEFTLGMLSRTYASWGDIRGTVSGLMGNASQEMANLREEETKAKAEGRFHGPEGEALKAQFENRRMEVGNKLIGYQQQLEQGWQDRLISSTVNAPGSFGMVASQFTRYEASKFLGAMSPAFGFSNVADRDKFMFRGPRLATSVLGNITQGGDGFLETAMSGASGGGALNNGVMSGASGGGSDITITVVVKDEAGNRLGSKSGHTTIHDIANGAFDLTANRHNASSAHN